MDVAGMRDSDHDVGTVKRGVHLQENGTRDKGTEEPLLWLGSHGMKFYVADNR